MKDRFMNGLIAGIIGGLVSSVIDIFFIDVLHFGDLRFYDFAGTLILGYMPHSIGEVIIGNIGHISFAAVLGVVFAFLITVISNKYIIVKGITYGLGVWFIAYVTTILFKVPQLTNISVNSVIVDYLSSAIYGAVLAYSYQILDRRYNII